MNSHGRINRSVSLLLVLALSMPMLMAIPDAATAGQAPETVVSSQITTDGDSRTAKLTWSAPTLYTDGTPVNEVVSYNVYEGLCSLSELPKVLGPITALTVTRTSQSVGQMCYQITASTPNGGESARTARGSKTFPFPRPNTAPTLTVE